MPICFLCNYFFLNIKLLCKHFIIGHPIHNFFECSCAEINCNRTFHLINSFRKHLAVHIINKPFELVHSSVNLINNSNNSVTLNNVDIVKPLFITNDSELNDSCTLDNYASKFLASLYSNPQVPRNVVQTVVDGISNIFNNIHHILKNKASNLLLNGNISNDCFNHFNSTLEVVEHPFTDLNTEYK